jgi:hypothetical protein
MNKKDMNKKEKIRNMIIDERKHIENIIISRINYLFTCFTIVIGSSIVVLEKKYFLSVIILSMGVIIIYLIRKTIIRCQIKLDIIMDYLLPKNHPNNKVNRIIKKIQDNNAYITEIYNDINDYTRKKRLLNKINKSKNVKDIVGFLMPNFCFYSLIVFDILIFLIQINEKLKYWFF